jgi:hypothetical protein
LGVLGFGPKLLGKVLVLGKTQKTQENGMSNYNQLRPINPFTMSLFRNKRFMLDEMT